MTHIFPHKLTATALGALAVSIAAPAFAQEAPSTPAITAAPPPPVVLSAPTAPVVPSTVQTAPAPKLVLTAPDIDVPETVKPVPQARAEKPAVKPSVATRAPATKSPSVPAPTAIASPEPAMTAETAVMTPPAVAQIRPSTPVRSTARSTTNTADVPIDWEIAAGLGGLALLGAGGIVAMTRRRRQTEVALETPATFEPEMVAPAAPVAPAPIPMHAPTAMPAFAGSASSMGRHERAAEMGPTTENPFLTLRARRRRARFYDRRERIAASQGTMQQQVVPPTVPAQHAETGQVTYVFGKNPARSSPFNVVRKV